MTKQYFFIPGRNRDLSIAEIRSVLHLFLGRKYTLSTKPEEYFLLESDVDVEVIDSIFVRLGGFLKYGVFLDESEKFIDLFPASSKRISYGLSTYNNGFPRNEIERKHKDIQKAVKETLKGNDRKGRYIGENDRILSSGQIIGNDLLEKGIELDAFIDKDGGIRMGKTLGVQDIDGFSERDFEKPSTDKDMGVLPPKLARIMINLASRRVGSLIWDPFCGSGNILLEGMILGYDMMGSDISKEAVSDSFENIKWLTELYDMKDVRYTAFEADVTNVDRRLLTKLQKSDISALVFEPYMGPPMKRVISPEYAQENIEKCALLFKSAVEIAEQLKNPSLKIVGVFPSYKTHQGWMTYRFNELFNKRWKVENLKGDGEGLHWKRSSSIIRRNLVVAQLKN